MSDKEDIPGRTSRAVALRHMPGDAAPPRITATGTGAVAEQILRVALDNGVKVREDADLAEILSKLEVDSPVPLEAFAAVAEILAYVYRSQNRPPPDGAESASQDSRYGDPHEWSRGWSHEWDAEGPPPPSPAPPDDAI